MNRTLPSAVSKLNSLVKDTAIYGLADFIFKFISFATFPIFTYALNVTEFGIFSLLITMSTLFGLLMMCGFNSAMQRLCLDSTTSLENRQIIISTGLWCLFSNACLMGSVLLVAAFIYQNFLKEGHQITLEMVLWSILSAMAMQINTFCLDIIRIEFKPWKYTLLNFTQNALLISLALFLVIKLQLGVLGYIAATSLAYLALMPFCLWMIRHNLLFRFNVIFAKQMLHFGYPFIFAGFGYWMFGSMDRWMLSEFSNYEEVGLYSIAFKIASVLIFINFAFGQAWTPFALRAHQSDPAYRSSYSRLMSLWFFALIMISLSTSLFGYEFLMLLTPPEYWQAATLLPYICLSLAMYGTTPILAMGIMIEKKTYHYSFAIGIAAASNFLLNWMFISDYGAQGASFATLCSNFILWIYYLRCSQRLHPIPIESKKILFCLCMAAFGLIFNFWINTLNWNYEILAYKCIFLMGLLGACFRVFFPSSFSVASLPLQHNG